MRTLRLAVPPGVGDVYWALSKVEALREKFGADHVRLCVQKAGPGRSVDWRQMVDFIDSGEFFPFQPGEAVKPPGYREDLAGVDALLWPNAIVDRGLRLEEWLPDLSFNLDFPVHTEHYPGPDRRVVVYASSEAINRAWLSELDEQYWLDVIEGLTHKLGQPVTLIGAGWDKAYADRLLAARHGRPRNMHFENLVSQTRLPQIADILRKARVVVGAISGMTILANHFKTPCVALYPNAHHPDFPRTWVKPGTPYEPICSHAPPPAPELVDQAVAIAR